MPGAVKELTAISPLAGKPAPREMLVDVSLLQREYCERRSLVVDGLIEPMEPREE